MNVEKKLSKKDGTSKKLTSKSERHNKRCKTECRTKVVKVNVVHMREHEQIKRCKIKCRKGHSIKIGILKMAKFLMV